jgi:type IV pilus biogenesis/stability protein PilW
VGRARAAAALLLALGACAHKPTARERETAVIHNDLAVEAMRAGRSQEALREYDEALKVDDGLAEAHLGRGLVLEFAFSRTDEAEAEYRRAIELKPTLPEAHNNLGQLLARTGRLDEALREFDAALAQMLYREPWVARCNKGQVLWRMGRKADGAAEMRACLKGQPLYCAGWREQGRLQLADGQVQEAVASFERYAATCDKVADAHQQLGLALLKAGKAERAREAFGRCAELAEGTDLGADCQRSRERLR